MLCNSFQLLTKRSKNASFSMSSKRVAAKKGGIFRKYTFFGSSKTLHPLILLCFSPALFCFTREMNIEGESEQAGCSQSPQTWLFSSMIGMTIFSIFRLTRNAWCRQKSRQICCSKSESEAHFGQVIAPLSATQTTRGWA